MLLAHKNLFFWDHNMRRGHALACHSCLEHIFAAQDFLRDIVKTLLDFYAVLPHSINRLQLHKEGFMGSYTSLAQQLTDARLMAEGIKKRADVVSKVGLDEAKATEIESLSQNLAALDNEQEELKALLKTKTAELSATQKKLKEVMGATKKLVKVAVDQSDWLTFGIGDKK